MNMADGSNSLCCGNLLSPTVANSRIHLQKCKGCGTYWCKHLTLLEGPDAWKSPNVTPQFMEALLFRRKLQAQKILLRCGNQLRQGKVLDYGCGPGIFTDFLRSNGIPCIGADLSPISTQTTDFLKLNTPWEIPAVSDVKTVLLLDVLEHSEHPLQLIQELSSLKTKYFIVKVPLATGPGFRLAHALARTGKFTFLEKLFLVGDIAPHVGYFTRQGLITLFKTGGFQIIDEFKIAEVGSELSRRVRGEYPFGEKIGPIVFSAIGLTAEMISSIWPDTSIFIFEKQTNGN